MIQELVTPVGWKGRGFTHTSDLDLVVESRSVHRRASYRPRTTKNFSYEWQYLTNYPQRVYFKEASTEALQRALLQVPSAARMREEEDIYKLDSGSSVGVEWIDILKQIIHFNDRGKAEDSSGQNKKSTRVTVTRCYMRCRASGRFMRGDGEADGLETSNISASHLTVGVSR